MTTRVLLFFAGLSFIFDPLAGQSFQWAKRAGLWAFDLGYGVATDNSGNVYIAGKYEMNASFGGSIVTCAGNHDMYVAKYDPSGNFLWVRTAGGTRGDYAWAIACDGSGNVYVTGEIEGTVSFGAGVSLTSNGDNDIFVAKYNTDGTLQWAKKLGGGTKSDKGLGIALTSSYVYITGKFEGTGNFAGTSLTSAGGRDMFLAKYTTGGTFLWAKRAGGTGDDEGYALATDPSGNIFVTGYYSGTANFGSINKTSKGAQDIFVAKYNSSGGIIWVRSAGGTAADYGMGIKVDGGYRVFLTGGCRLKSTFGAHTVTASGGNADIFIARYDNSGNAMWVRKAGGTLNDYGRALALDVNSNIFITGNYGFTATFGTTAIQAPDSTDIYFASYDKSGNFRWVLKSGGEPDESDPGRFLEMGLSIATDPSGNVLASGAYRSKTSFGTTTLSAWDHTDVYIVKIAPTNIVGARLAMAQLAITPADSASFCVGGYVTLRAVQDSVAEYRWMKDGRIIGNATSASYTATSPGNYNVMVIRGHDSLRSAVTKVTETKRLVSTITANTDVFCLDSNNVLMATTCEGCFYQWKRNGANIRGAHSYTYAPAREGDYQVNTIQGSCFHWSESRNVSFLECGTRDTASAHDAADISTIENREDSLLTTKVYPNPNNGLFTLEINMSRIAERSSGVRIEVINSMGQLFYEKVIINPQNSLSEQVTLSGDIQMGVYFLKVTIDERVETNKIMLIR